MGANMIDELKRNGSGYYDPTAYEAMKGCMNMNPKKGELWTVMMGNGSERECIVLAVDETYATILFLFDSGDIEIQCRGVRYTNAGQMQYAYLNKFGDYIKTMPDAEFDFLMMQIADYFEIPVREKVVEVEKIVEVEKEVSVPASNGFPFEEYSKAMQDATKYQTERDVYKKLYDDLLKSVMNR